MADIRVDSPCSAGLTGAVELPDGRVLMVVNDPLFGTDLFTSDGSREGTRLLRELKAGLGSQFWYEITAVRVGDVVYFIGDTNDEGEELWKTDGTTDRTTMVAASLGLEDLANLTAFNGEVLFTADAAEIGFKLWRSDGTDSGTRDVAPASPTSHTAGPLTIAGNRVFFFGRTAANPHVELWVTDAAGDGGLFVAEVGDPIDFGTSRYLTDLGDRAVFAGQSDGDGREPWISDGTPSGTSLLANVRPGPDSSSPRGFVTLPWADRVVFIADDGNHGAEPWITDGTPSGTSMLRDLAPGPDGSNLVPLGTCDGLLYFEGNDASHGREIWRSDGSSDGTFLLADLAPGAASSYTPWGTRPSICVDGWFVFPASPDSSGGRVYRTAGTAASTTVVAGPVPGFNFTRGLTARGSEVWAGSHADTILVIDVGSGGARFLQLPCTGNIGSEAGALLLETLGDRLLFSASLPELGTEPWVSDGTSPGTRLVEDIRPGPDSGLGSAPAPPGSRVGDVLVLPANDGVHGVEPWRIDGTTLGTHMLADTAAGAASGWISTTETRLDDAVFSGRLYFEVDRVSSPFNRRVVWSTDGTTTGTTLVPGWPEDLSLDSGTFAPATTPRGLVFPANYDPPFASIGTEPWITDGSPGGISLIKDIYPGVLITDSSNPASLTRLGDVVLFWARHPLYGTELWRTDGTAGGTRLVLDIAPGTGSGSADAPSKLTTLGTDVALFTANDGVHGPELWRSDGTSAGTGLIADCVPGTDGLEPDDLLEGGGVTWFIGTVPGHSRTLWRSDGTAEGTFMVADIAPTMTGTGGVSDLVLFHEEVLYFLGSDGRHGYELWRSDGTRQGTRLAADLAPGPASTSYPLMATALPGDVGSPDRPFFLAAAYAPTGAELLRITPDTTPPVVDGITLSPSAAESQVHDTVARPGDRPQRLWIWFSEAMAAPVDESFPANAFHPEGYRVVQAGLDGLLETPDCGAAPGGDDLEIEVAAVTYDPLWRSTAVELAAGLSDGPLRLMVCAEVLTDLDGNELDGDQDGVGGDDLTFDTLIIGANLAVNGGFDHDLAGWTLSGPPGVNIDHGPFTAGWEPSSGSLRIEGVADINEVTALDQCVPILGGALHQVSASLRIVSDTAGSPEVRWAATSHDEPNCAGDPLTTITGSLWAGDTDGRWKTVGSRLRPPVEAASARVTFTVEPTAVTAFEVLLDELVIRRVPTLFDDGFESGDESAWSAMQP